MQLHAIIFREIFDIDTRDIVGQQYVSYMVNSEEAIAIVDAGDFDVVFFYKSHSNRYGAAFRQWEYACHRRQRFSILSCYRVWL